MYNSTFENHSRCSCNDKAYLLKTKTAVVLCQECIQSSHAGSVVIEVSAEASPFGLLIFSMKQITVAFILAVRTASGILCTYLTVGYLRTAYMRSFNRNKCFEIPNGR